jgi:hypothetical protein
VSGINLRSSILLRLRYNDIPFKSDRSFVTVILNGVSKIFLFGRTYLPHEESPANNGECTISNADCFDYVLFSKLTGDSRPAERRSGGLLRTAVFYHLESLYRGSSE